MRKQFNRILCATDFSDVSEPVVPYGIKMATELEATLYVCHVIDLPTVSVYGEAVFDPINEQQRFMDFSRNEIESLVKDAPIEWQPLVALGQTTEEISRLAAENAIDLVITATHGRSGLRRLFLGSVTERLMRTLSCPLLVLRSSGEEGKSLSQQFPFRKVLVGYDFSPDSEAAFHTTLSIAQEFECEFHIMHVVEPSAYKELTFPSAPGEPLQKDLYDSITSRLAGLVPQEALHWCTLQTQVMVGKPYAELIRYAEIQDIDLIVIGVRGHGRVEELLVGSTTDRVIRRAPCPVLSVSPPQKSPQSG